MEEPEDPILTISNKQQLNNHRKMKRSLSQMHNKIIA
jgi:hypothetical protein